MSLIPLLFDIETNPNNPDGLGIYICRICKHRSDVLYTHRPMFNYEAENIENFLGRHFVYHILLKKFDVNHDWNQFTSRNSQIFRLFLSPNNYTSDLFSISKCYRIFTGVLCDQSKYDAGEDVGKIRSSELSIDQDCEDLAVRYFINLGRECILCEKKYAVFPADDVIYRHVYDCVLKFRKKLKA